jgi:DNA-binding cell septation regulator SpoVG
VIHGAKVIQQEGQRAWVGMPSQKSGERWSPVVEVVSESLRDRIRGAVLEAWETWS